MKKIITKIYKIFSQFNKYCNHERNLFPILYEHHISLLYVYRDERREWSLAN